MHFNEPLIKAIKSAKWKLTEIDNAAYSNLPMNRSASEKCEKLKRSVNRFSLQTGRLLKFQLTISA